MSLRDAFSGPLSASDSVLLAVSGGADSMALLHGMTLLRGMAMLNGTPTSRGTAGLCGESASEVRSARLGVAHLNHGLRGSDSSKDREFVKAACEQRQLPFFSEEILVLNQLRAGESVEEACRRHRYDFLLRVAREHQFSAIATAHHQDDQAETVLHNILRGTGLRGLAGMSVTRDLEPGVQLVRPLLNVSRSEILAFLAEAEVSWRDDASNADLTYTRNRLRHQVLPDLAANVNPQVIRHLAGLAVQAGEALGCIDQLAIRFLEQCVLQERKEIIRLRRDSFLQVESFLARHALGMLWDRVGWSKKEMTASHWIAAESLLRTGQPSSLCLPHGIRMEVDKGIGRLFDSTHHAPP